jgi:predicted nucleic acid-binding protein
LSLSVDTSVCSLALRRDRPPDVPEVGTIDAILAQLCIRYELRLLTTDADFARIAEHEPPERWTP